LFGSRAGKVLGAHTVVVDVRFVMNEGRVYTQL